MTFARAGAVAGAAATVLFGWAFWLEPRRVAVRRERLALPHWPAALDGLKVAVVSDLHTGAPHVDERKVARVVAKVNAERPDLVALLGDFVDPDVPLGTPVPPGRVAARLGELAAPAGVFAVLGNQDWAHTGPVMLETLRDAGITVLENDATATTARGHPVWVAGIADAATRDPDPGQALEAVPEGAPVIVLSHDPDVFARVPARVALTLSGHTHHGQVNLPLLRRLIVHSRFGYVGGHVVEGGRHLYVSAGIGTARLPARFMAPPAIAILELSPSGGA